MCRALRYLGSRELFLLLKDLATSVPSQLFCLLGTTFAGEPGCLQTLSLQEPMSRVWVCGPGAQHGALVLRECSHQAGWALSIPCVA